MTTPNRRKSVRSDQPTKNRRSAVQREPTDWVEALRHSLDMTDIGAVGELRIDACALVLDELYTKLRGALYDSNVDSRCAFVLQTVRSYRGPAALFDWSNWAAVFRVAADILTAAGAPASRMPAITAVPFRSDLDMNAGDWEFSCPTCGSHNFRTDVRLGVRECKGHYRAPGCTFRWLATDDSKYHRLVRLPPDRKQFILSNPDGTGRVVVRLEGEQDLPSTQIMLAVLGDMLRRGFKSTEVP